MGPRAALILGLFVLAPCLAPAVGCGGDFSSGGGPDHPFDMSFPSNGDMGFPPNPCALVSVVAPPDEHAPLPVTLSLSVSNTGGHPFVWHMQRFTGENTVLVDQPTNPFTNQATIQRYGTYYFYVVPTDGSTMCSTRASYFKSSGLDPQLYVLRAMPPANRQFPAFEKPFTVFHGSPDGTQNVNLAAGAHVAGTLSAAGGPVSGQVRFVAAQDFLVDALAITGPKGSFDAQLQPAGSYNVLLIPTEPAMPLAPSLTTTPAAGAAWAVQTSYAVSAGVAVAGTVRDGSGAVAGAHVSLRAGPLPSSLETSAADGSFTLRTQTHAGYTLAVGGGDWPGATAGSFDVLDGNVSLAVTYTAPRVPVTGTVFGSDGKPLVGARVTIEQAAIPVGNVVVSGVAGGPRTLVATGSGSRVVTTGAGGALPPLQLPDTTQPYKVTVEPPTVLPGDAGVPSAPGDGLTVFHPTVGAAWSFTLAPKVDLHVHVTRADGKTPGPMTSVTAVEDEGLHASVAPYKTTSAQDYYLHVDPGSSSTVVVQPDVGDGLQSMRVPVAAGVDHADVTLPAGLGVSGRVIYNEDSNDFVRYVRVEVHCYQCATPDAVIASAVGDEEGVYTLYVPDPGPVTDMGSP